MFFTTVTHPLSKLCRKVGRRNGLTCNILKPSHPCFPNFNASAPAFKGKDSVVTVVKNLFYSGKPMLCHLMHNQGLSR